jgi:hypothetical protein
MRLASAPITPSSKLKGDAGANPNSRELSNFYCLPAEPVDLSPDEN